jgi:hypothetical protein
MGKETIAALNPLAQLGKPVLFASGFPLIGRINETGRRLLWIRRRNFRETF